MNDEAQCSQCGAVFPAGGSPGGLCPECLLKLGLSDGEPAGTKTTVEERQSGRDLPDRIGAYRILEVLGEGGMGIVYLAEQHEPVRRRVALKIIKLGMDTEQVIARFESERQALAIMNHPGVAKVFDAGVTEHGRPYFVMEHVPGVSITAYCDERNLSIPQRLELFMQACGAIQHAHQKGIIHRDVKPSNVLVMLEDDQPRVKVIDFGVAKATSQRLTEKTLFTRQGVLIGTPEYMSPEQAGTTALDVDTRTDIYSLGVLLYELLVGALPFDPRTLREAAAMEMLRIIREDDPPSPTTRISSLGDTVEEIARHRRLDARGLTRQLRGELEWITMRALDKDPARRYPSASELAADVRRHLDDEPVAAGPPSAAYRLGKIVRRHKGPLAAAAAVLIVLLVGLTASSILYLREQAARTRAAEQRAEAQRQSYVANIAAADLHLRASETAMATRRLEACEPELRGWEWRHLSLKSDSSLRLIRVGDDIREVSFSPDQRRIFGLSGDAMLVWDATDGEILRSFRPERGDETGGEHEFRAIGYHRDGRLVAHASSPADPNAPFVAFAEHVRVSDSETGEAIAKLPIPKSMSWGAFNTEGSRLLTKWDHHDVYSLWDLESGRLVATLGELPDSSSRGWASLGTSRAAMSPDGSRFVFPSIDGYVRTVDVVSGQLLDPWKADHLPRVIEFHPQGGIVVSVDRDALRIWNPVNGDDVKVIPRVGGGSSIAWSRDGKKVACGARSGRIRVVDVDAEKVVDNLMGHDGEVTSIAFSADGKRIVSAGMDGTIRFWDAEARRSPVRTGKTAEIQAKGTDGRWVLARLEGATAVWDLDAGDFVSTLNEREHRSILQAWGFDFETKRMGLVRGGMRYRSRGVNVESIVEPVSLETWDMESGNKIATMEGSHTKIHAVAFGPGGAWLAAGSEDGGVRLWDADTGASIGALQTSSAPHALAASPDGKTLAVGYSDGSAEVLDRATLDTVVTLENHESPIVAINFSPDGRRILSAAADRLRVTDASSGRTLATLDEKDVSSVAYSPDGSRIVTGSGTAGRLRVWDAERFELLLTLEIAEGVAEAVFSQDGNRIVAISTNGTSRVWQTGRRE